MFGISGMLDAGVSFRSGACARVLKQRGFDEAIWKTAVLRGVNPLYLEKASYFDDQVGLRGLPIPTAHRVAKLVGCSNKRAILRDFGFWSRVAGRVA
jgi:hypothetical protein